MFNLENSSSGLLTAVGSQAVTRGNEAVVQKEGERQNILKDLCSGSLLVPFLFLNLPLMR